MTVLNPEPNQEPAKVEQASVNVAQKTQETPQQTTQEVEDPNWRSFREGRKKDREEMALAQKRAEEKEKEVAALKAAMEAAFSKSAPTPQAYQQYYGTNGQEEETEEQKIDKRVNALLAQREEQAKRDHQQREQQEYPQRLVRDFPDFNQVISQENLDYIDYHYPEVSRPLQRFQDGYEKWADIYRAVKKFVPNHANAKKEAAKADANSMKPKSMSGSNSTPSGEPARNSFQETEAKRAENWARMQKTLRSMS